MNHSRTTTGGQTVATGWTSVPVGDDGWQVAVKGYGIVAGRTHQGTALAGLVRDAVVQEQLAAFLSTLDGHFCLRAERQGEVWAAVDRVASFPLFIGSDGRVSDRPLQVTDTPLSQALDTDTAGEMALAGFSTGTATLHRGVRRLAVGELCHVRGPGQVDFHRWHQYRPWRVRPELTPERARTELKDILHQLFQTLAQGCAGRPIVVPLSAGLDSRLIVSGLHAAGVKDVHCFAYGQPGNYEAIASRQIAERLGYRWTFVPYTLSRQRAALTSALHDEYIAFADSLSATPFEQDFLAIRDLTEQGWLPADCVMINGQSGDYLTGGHVPPSLAAPLPDLSAAERFDRVFAALVKKHYDLWQSAQTPDLMALIKARLLAHLNDIGLPEVPAEAPHGAYEVSEYENRQAKYVVPGQRVYDFFGIDWRLPLWEKPLIDFYEGVPASLKVGQALYREVLWELDWGGVWQGYRTPPRTVLPGWLRGPRLLARLACAPFGRQTWHRVEKQVFGYPMDVLLNMAFLPYLRVLGDRRGYRNAFSWVGERYLAGHGLDWRGQPATQESAGR